MAFKKSYADVSCPPSPGERCEDRGRAYQDSCANQCPRSCTDVWEHVQCLQGACHPGSRSFEVFSIISKVLNDDKTRCVSLSLSFCILLSQDVAVPRASCCRTVSVFQWRSVDAGSHQATAHWSSFPKRNCQLTVIPGRNGFVLNVAVLLTLNRFDSLSLSSPVASVTAVCVRMALWCAPSSPAPCTIPGVLGAPAQFPVGGAKGQEPVSAGTQRAVLPVRTPINRRAVTCQHVQV